MRKMTFLRIFLVIMLASLLVNAKPIEIVNIDRKVTNVSREWHLNKIVFKYEKAVPVKSSNTGRRYSIRLG